MVEVAPTRTLTIIGDQPIANVKEDGAYPEMWFTQFLQRLASFIGQPPDSTGTTGATLTEIAVSAQILSEIAIAIATGATGGATNAIGAMQGMAVARIPSQPLPQPPIAVIQRPQQPLPQPAGLNQAQVMALNYFGF